MMVEGVGDSGVAFLEDIELIPIMFLLVFFSLSLRSQVCSSPQWKPRRAGEGVPAARHRVTGVLLLTHTFTD